MILDSLRGNIGGMASDALPIDQMTVVEKLMAMESLWDRLCQDEAQIPVREWHKQVLDQRLQQIAAGEAKFIDWETAKAKILERIS